MGVSITDLLGDHLPDKLQHRIEIGNVYRIPLGKEDGLIVPHEHKYLLKYFIVIGFDDDGNIYGGLLISSDQPKGIRRELLLYQYSVKAENNTFLKRDSWINCTHIFPSSQDKLSINNYLGCLDKESLYYIISAILDENNPVITKKERKKYNIQLPKDPDNFF